MGRPKSFDVRVKLSLPRSLVVRVEIVRDAEEARLGGRPTAAEVYRRAIGEGLVIMARQGAAAAAADVRSGEPGSNAMDVKGEQAAGD